MTFPIIISIAAVVFVIGIVFIMKAISSKEQEAVPISNPNEIKALKDAFLPPEEKDGEAGAAESKLKEKRFFSKSKKQIEIDQYVEENRRLKNALNEQKDKFKYLEENLATLMRDYHQIRQMESEKTTLLKAQIAKIQLEKEQLGENHKTIEELKRKSELIEQKQRDSLTQQREMQQFIEQLRADKEELMQAAQNPSVAKEEFDSLTNRLEGSIETIEHLKGENIQLQQLNEDLKESFKKTEELNAHLLEKEKIVQYELTKNRAQAIGLEKICEDFKVQIESMSPEQS